MNSNATAISPLPRTRRDRQTRAAARPTSCDNMSPFESWMSLCLAPAYFHYQAKEEFSRDSRALYSVPFEVATLFMCIAEVAVFGAAGLMLWGFAKCLAKLIRKAQRPMYYPQERMRRRLLAKERRSIRKRFTLNQMPTAEMLLEQWGHVHESPRDMIAFGSMLCDLEAYVDNSLIRDEYGEIIGRHPGIRGWLADNCPQLGTRYKTVMKYKTMAEKFRQAIGLTDPYPATLAFDNYENTVRNSKNDGETGTDGNDENMVRNSQDGDKKGADGVNENTVRKALDNAVIGKAKEAAKVLLEEFGCGSGDQGKCDAEECGNGGGVQDKCSTGKTENGSGEQGKCGTEKCGKTAKRHMVTRKWVAAVLDGRLSPESVPFEIEIQERRQQGLPDRDGLLRKFTEMMA